MPLVQSLFDLAKAIGAIFCAAVHIEESFRLPFY